MFRSQPCMSGHAISCCAHRVKLAAASCRRPWVLTRPPIATRLFSHCSPIIWEGLSEWRQGLRSLGQRRWDPGAATAAPPATPMDDSHMEGAAGILAHCKDLGDAAVAVLCATDPLQKTSLTHAAMAALAAGKLRTTATALVPGLRRPRPDLPSFPGRPAQPRLVDDPREIPPPKASPLPLAVYVLHNLAHVELNAIDLAWDTVARFSHLCLPPQFYIDFARVADDESRHFLWCVQRLEELGYGYGCMPAHRLLWDGCQRSRGSLVDRMAVVPMSQEARGLDAGPRLAARLVGMGDNRSAAIVRRIALEESAHVAVGVAWFRAACAARGRAPGPAYRDALRALCPDLLRPPFDAPARRAVGLPPAWFDPETWPHADRVDLDRARARGGPAAGAATPRGVGEGDDDLVHLSARMEAFLAEELGRAAEAQQGEPRA